MDLHHSYDDYDQTHSILSGLTPPPPPKDDDVTYVERIKKVFINVRSAIPGVRCQNPYQHIFDTDIPNVLSISLDDVNISGTFNPDDRSIVLYIKECVGTYEWYDSALAVSKHSISPFAVLPITKYKYARLKRDPIVKTFEYPIPVLNTFTLYFLNLDGHIDSRIMYAELWFTIRHLAPASIDKLSPIDTGSGNQDRFDFNIL
jgi:hypothetical protein